MPHGTQALFSADVRTSTPRTITVRALPGQIGALRVSHTCSKSVFYEAFVRVCGVLHSPYCGGLRPLVPPSVRSTVYYYKTLLVPGLQS
jgi:hypothetical protein